MAKEEIKWYYDNVLNSKGNAVEVGAIKADSVANISENKNESYRIMQGVTAEAIDNKLNQASNGATDSEIEKLRAYAKQALNSGKVWKTKDEFNADKYAKDLYTYGFIETYNEVNTNIKINSTENLSFTASMTEVSIGINNQWIEGNGADSMFSGAVDAMAQLTQGGAVSSLNNTLDQLGLSQSDVVKSVKRLNQVHYRSSTQFMKAFKGTNVSIPISINRTFVYDRYGRLWDNEIKMIASWALGEEISLDGWTNTDEMVNEAGKEEHIRSFMGGVASSVVSYMAKTGGVIQRGPLGYLYNAAAWRKMMNPTAGVIPGTCYVKFPNGIVIPDLLVSDMSIQMSSTQVLTEKGLRPLTVTIAIQFMPCRTWGFKDALAILDYTGTDTSKIFEA